MQDSKGTFAPLTGVASSIDYEVRDPRISLEPLPTPTIGASYDRDRMIGFMHGRIQALLEEVKYLRSLVIPNG